MNTAPKLFKSIRDAATYLQKFSDGGQHRHIQGPLAGTCYDIGNQLLDAADKLASLAPPSGDGVGLTVADAWFESPTEITIHAKASGGAKLPEEGTKIYTTPQSAPVDGDPLLSAAEQFVAACKDGNADTLLDYFADIFGEAIAALSAQVIAPAEIVGQNDPMPKDWCTLAVGDGSGRLFVHGHYDAIKICQAALLARNDAAMIAAATPPTASQERGGDSLRELLIDCQLAIESIPRDSSAKDDLVNRLTTAITRKFQSDNTRFVETLPRKLSEKPPSSAGEPKETREPLPGEIDAYYAEEHAKARAAEQAKLVAYTECTRDCDCVGECKAGLEQAKPVAINPVEIDTKLIDEFATAEALGRVADQAQAGELPDQIDVDTGIQFLEKMVHHPAWKGIAGDIHMPDNFRRVATLLRRLAGGVTVDKDGR